MTTTPDKQPYDDKNKRWNMISRLVENYGTYEDSVAWALCRNDAIRWRIESHGKNKIVKKDSKTIKTERIVFGISCVVIVIGSYITFKILGIL